MSNDHRNESLSDLSRAIVGLVRGVEAKRHHYAFDEHLTETEYKAFTRVADAGALTPTNLALWLGVTTGTVTAISDRLVEAGYLERSPHPEDRRSVILTVTPFGRETIQRIYANFADTLGAAVHSLSEPALRDAIRLMRDITAAVTPDQAVLDDQLALRR